MDYQKSIELARALGYQEISDTNAFKGVLFVKDGLKWIHNIDGLKNHLGVTSSQELALLDYDVDAYFKRENYTNEMADDEMKGLYLNLQVEEGEPVYMSDGMYLFPDGSLKEL